MKTALIVFTLIVVVVPIVGLGYYYRRFRNSAEAQWRHRVERQIRELESRRAELRAFSSRVEQSIQALADNYLKRILEAIPINHLVEFPNIGPATVAKLEDVGYRRVAEVVNIRFENFAGIGESRARDLRAAVKSLVKEAKSRFDSGACPEAQEYRRKVDALRTAEAERTSAIEMERIAVEEALREAHVLGSLAREITFAAYFLGREISAKAQEAMSRPLPEPRPAPPPPPPVVKPPPEPPAVVPVAPVIAAERAPQPFPLPPAPPPPPPLPADLFRAELNSPQPEPPAAEHPGLPRLRSLVRFGFAVAKADGRIAQAERREIRAYLEASFGHDPVLSRHIDPIMEQIAKSVPEEAEAVAEIREAVPPAERQALYEWAERIAAASGEHNKKERDALTRIAAALGLQAAPAPAPVPAPSPAPDPFAILEIAPGTPLDADLIRRRYLMLMDRLDPARAAALGPDFARMAEEKRTRVRAAAESLIAPFNEPLEREEPPAPADLRHNPDLDDVFGV
jgi:uncharacterized tellurite resistance protein B-like protein